MGDGENASLRLQFNPKVRLEFHGSTITSDAGLLAFREFDDALGLTRIAEDYLQESRTGRNILHHLVPLLRQSIYSRLAGYDDTNDAVRLSQDPAMRVIVGWQGSERKGASTSEMGRFETEFLTVKGGEKVYHCGGGIVYHRHDEKGLNWEPGGIRSGAGVRSSGVSQESTGSSDTWEAALCLLRLRR